MERNTHELPTTNIVVGVPSPVARHGKWSSGFEMPAMARMGHSVC